MKSSRKYLKSTIYRAGLSGILLMGLISPPADAFSFPWQKKAKELPPAAETKPSMLEQEGNTPVFKPTQVITPESQVQPSQQAQPSQQGQPAVTPKTHPPDTHPSGQRAQAVDPMKDLSEQGVFPEALQTQSTPVTRAQLAEVMVKALKHDTKLVSEFPFYRDVPLSDPAYVPVEVLRAKRLLVFPNDHGFFHPERPITYGDLYLAISQSITGVPPAPERAEHLLQAIPERNTLTKAQYDAVAKMAQSRFFGRVRRHETKFQPVEAEVTPEGLAPYISFMMYLNERRTPISAGEEVLPELPAGLHLVISPSTGVLEERLKAGGRIRFQLTEAAGVLPRGSMLRGVVESALPNRTYKIVFDAVRTTEGQNYETRADLTIAFSPKDKLGFIVPGETFEIVTQKVPSDVVETTAPLEQETPAENAPPPATPAKNAPNREILKQPIKTVPK